MPVSEFKLPDGMEIDEDDIHERMLQGAPRNFDVSEGSLFFDVTRPTAEEKSRMVNFNLAIVLQMMFPQFAEGEYLDYHGESIRLTRHPAELAKGHITFVGEPETRIDTGTIVMTSGGDDESPIRFETMIEGVIDESGEVTLPISAVEPGAHGNVPAHTIVALNESINGVDSIYNENRLMDGSESEEDDHYRERIMDRRKNQALSGSRGDYKTWALEVEGVGDAVVIPEADGFGTGTTKVLIMPREGGKASEELIKEVQDHIAPDGRNGGGLAPIGALVSVGTVEQLKVNLSFESLELKEGYEVEEAFSILREFLSNYFTAISNGGKVRYTHIGPLVLETGAIKDYRGLLINGGTDNIDLSEEQIAVVGEVTIIDTD